MPEKCNNHCTKVVTAECDIQHMQEDIAEIKGTQGRIFDKIEGNFKWLLGLATGVALEFVGMIVMIVLTLKSAGN